MVNCRICALLSTTEGESCGCFVLMHLVHCLLLSDQHKTCKCCVCCNCSVELSSACMAECQPKGSFTLPPFLPLPSCPSGSSSLAYTCWLVIGLALCACEFISGIFHLVFLNVIMLEEGRRMRTERNSCSWLRTWCLHPPPSTRTLIILVIKHKHVHWVRSFLFPQVN